MHHDAQPGSRAGLRKSAQPLTFTLGAMNNLSIFSVSPVAVFAAGCVAGSGGSLLRLAQSVLGAAGFCFLGLLRFVVMFASNPALKFAPFGRWDAPSARPLALRWASSYDA